MILEDFEYADSSDREIAQLCLVSHPFVIRIRAELNKPASQNKFIPVSKRHKAQKSQLETLPPPDIQGYDQRDDVLKELAEENEALTDR